MIPRQTIDAAEIYSRELVGRNFLYVYGEVVDFIFSKDASVAKYDTLLVKDERKGIPASIGHLLSNSFLGKR